MFPDSTVNYLPSLYPVTPNNRTRLAERGRRFV